MRDPTIGQILLGIAIITGISAGLCLLIWLAERSLKQRGLIVPRQEPPPAWVELGKAQREFGRAVVEALRIERVVAWLAARLNRPGHDESPSPPKR